MPQEIVNSTADKENQWQTEAISIFTLRFVKCTLNKT
jgi:hypothetical protein